MFLAPSELGGSPRPLEGGEQHWAKYAKKKICFWSINWTKASLLQSRDSVNRRCENMSSTKPTNPTKPAIGTVAQNQKNWAQTTIFSMVGTTRCRRLIFPHFIRFNTLQGLFSSHNDAECSLTNVVCHKDKESWLFQNLEHKKRVQHRFRFHCSPAVKKKTKHVSFPAENAHKKRRQ